MKNGIKLKQVSNIPGVATLPIPPEKRKKMVFLAQGQICYGKNLILYKPGYFLDFATMHEIGHFLSVSFNITKNRILREKRAWLFASLFIEKEKIPLFVNIANKYLSTFSLISPTCEIPFITEQKVYNFRKNWSHKKVISNFIHFQNNVVFKKWMKTSK